MSTQLVETDFAIKIPFPETDMCRLEIAVGACRLRITPGDGFDLVSGTYHDPTGMLPLSLRQTGETLRVSQTFNPIDFWGDFSNPPLFELALGRIKPYSLEIQTGASECLMDLGGLPITLLNLEHGAGRVEINFSAPNPETLHLLEISSGASATVLKNLANANFLEMRLEGGAAGYELDLSGKLRQNARLSIETGLADVKMWAPPSTAVKIMPEAVMGSVRVGDDFIKRGEAFYSPAALQGDKPMLSVRANVVLGSFQVRS